jgi:hypothetical protein
MSREIGKASQGIFLIALWTLNAVALGLLTSLLVFHSANVWMKRSLALTLAGILALLLIHRDCRENSNEAL